MFSDHFAILQLSRYAGIDELEHAYIQSQRRYQRLTASGPLRFYRVDILEDAKRAYQAIRKQLTNRDDDITQTQGARGTQSILAKQAATRYTHHTIKPPIKSSITEEAIIDAGPMNLRSRTIARLRAELASPKRATPDVEDAFCRQIIYRVEGDLIRYDARRELLNIAQQNNIKLFRANMLIAQIVESIRQHKLYQQPQQDTPATKKHKHKGKNNRLALKIAIIIVVMIIVAAIDLFLIQFLEGN